jgi:aminomuconate-semialdehyde/2-hydroxymuconate-6-semialdehyde dehydrogenase
MEDRAINYTLRQPLGVCGCISPWNLPLYLFTWKIAPALAAGNCVVAKPSELTPMTSYLLAAICREVSLPPGVLNIVHGYGHKAGQAIVENETIQALSFTGGTETGKQIATTVAPSFKKLSLEMGGKNPNIVFADCNFDEALSTSVKSSFANQGEICLCGSRIFIERSIYNQFRDGLVDKARQLQVGDPQHPDTNLGAVISADHKQKILSYVQLAKEEGGTVLTGGEAVDVGGRCAGGSFVQPTVIEGLDEHCRVNQEEIFGPVVTLIPFDREEEAIRMANATEYGLAATIWTQDVSRAHRVARQVQSGIIWINCWLLRDLRTPFGGMKHSGLGREGGWEAFRFFTEPKNVCVKV